MRNRLREVLGRNLDLAAVILIVVVGAWFRLATYGDLRLSIATLDTQSYMSASRTPLFSWNSFTAERLFGTNALYQLAGARDCSIQALSVPAIGKESHRQDQACFEGIVVTQAFLSVLGWGLFVFAFAAALTSPFARLAAACILTAFAFVPQIADWDSILSSESLTFSLFALSLGLVLLILVRMQRNGLKADVSKPSYVLIVAALLSLGLWTFIRDPDVYTVLLFCLMAFAVVLPQRPLPGAGIVGLLGLVVICALAIVSSMQSGRWKIPLSGAYETYVLPEPSYVLEMQHLGMPNPASPQFNAWFDQHGASTYALFLVSHPRFVTATVFDNMGHLFSDNNQPYFKTPDLPLRNAALQVGDWVHPKSTAVILAALLTASTMFFTGLRTRSRRTLVWAWFLGWLLVSALMTIVLTFFADPGGVERHVLFSVVLLRLLLWLGLLALMDLVIAPQEAPAQV